jgi:hypothetical protein
MKTVSDVTLTWLCTKCFGKPRVPLRKVGACGDITSAYCMRCGGNERFVMTHCQKQITVNRTKRKLVKIKLNKDERKSLLKSVVNRGILVRDKALWSDGLLELGSL